MSKTMTKYARGTIWMVKNNTSGQYQAGVQSGGRPFLVMSNNDRGDNCTAVEGLWCTSQQKPFMRINVAYRNDRGEINTVLCNQHATLNINQLNEYLGTLSDDKMREVEEGMLFACGMGRYIDLEKNFNKLLQTIQDSENEKIKSYLEGQMEEITRINLIISQLQANLQKRLECPGRTDTTLEIKVPESPKTPKTRKVLTEGKKRRARWTKEAMLEFIKDKESMPLSDLCKKYQVTKGSACTMYYNFKAKVDADESPDSSENE